MSADFQDVQRAMARYLRDPEHHPAPAGVEDRRIGIYRYAVFANALEFMSDNFPRLRDVMPDGDWEILVREYFINHEAATHLFCELPHEFLDFLTARGVRPGDPDYLLELAAFECLENDVAIDGTDPDAVAVDAGGDVMTGIPVLNPVARLVRFQYPVHIIGADYQPDERPAQDTWIVAYRNRDSEFGFLDVNPLTATLVDLLAANETASGADMLRDLAGQLGYEPAEGFVAAGSQILERLRGCDVLLGTRPAG